MKRIDIAVRMGQIVGQISLEKCGDETEEEGIPSPSNLSILVICYF